MNLEIKITKKEIIASVVLLFFAGMVFLAVRSAINFELQYEEALLATHDKLFLSGESETYPFDNLSLSAKSYFVWDVKKEQAIGGSNQEMQFPLASLTKLMTILVASQLSTNETKVTISDADLRTDGDNGLVAGERWKLSDLIDFTLLTSSNDGAQAMASVIKAFSDIPDERTAREIFLEGMNEEAQKLGMTQSFFLNETGLDINKTLSGGYGSAKDIAVLVENILENYPGMLEASSYGKIEVSSNMLSHLVDNTNSSVENLPNIVASKTGFTDLAGGNLVVVFDAGINHKIIVSVLGSTKEERFTDVEKLVWATLEKVFNDNQKI